MHPARANELHTSRRNEGIHCSNTARDAPKAAITAAAAAVTRVGEWPKPITPFSASDATDNCLGEKKGKKEEREDKINMQIAIYSFVTVLPSFLRPSLDKQTVEEETDADDEEEFMKRTDGGTDGDRDGVRGGLWQRVEVAVVRRRMSFRRVRSDRRTDGGRENDN